MNQFRRIRVYILWTTSHSLLKAGSPYHAGVNSGTVFLSKILTLQRFQTIGKVFLSAQVVIHGHSDHDILFLGMT